MPPSFQLEGIDCAHAIRERASGHRRGGAVRARRRGVRARAARPGSQRPRLPVEGPDLAGRRARARDPRGPRRGQHRRPVDRRAPVGTERRRGARAGAPGHDGEGPGLRGDRRRARHDAGGRRLAGDRAVPADGRRRRGRPSLVDEFKRLHAAVVEQTTSRKTLRVVRPAAAGRSTGGAPRDGDRAAGGRGERAVLATSAGSRRSPNGSRRATSRRSSASISRRWPRSCCRSAA